MHLAVDSAGALTHDDAAVKRVDATSEGLARDHTLPATNDTQPLKRPLPPHDRHRSCASYLFIHAAQSLSATRQRITITRSPFIVESFPAQARKRESDRYPHDFHPRSSSFSLSFAPLEVDLPRSARYRRHVSCLHASSYLSNVYVYTHRSHPTCKHTCY